MEEEEREKDGRFPRLCRFPPPGCRSARISVEMYVTADQREFSEPVADKSYKSLVSYGTEENASSEARDANPGYRVVV